MLLGNLPLPVVDLLVGMRKHAGVLPAAMLTVSAQLGLVDA